MLDNVLHVLYYGRYKQTERTKLTGVQNGIFI